MRKSETLRGRGSFRAVARSGMRVDGIYLRSYALLRSATPPSFAVGVTVYGRGINAVRRNRIKRRLREAIRKERGRILEAVCATGTRLELVLGYRKGGEEPIAPFAELHADVIRAMERIFRRMQQWPRQ